MYFALSAIGGRSVYTGIFANIPSHHKGHGPLNNTLLMMYPRASKTEIKRKRCESMDGRVQQCIGRIELRFKSAHQKGGTIPTPKSPASKSKTTDARVKEAEEEVEKIKQRIEAKQFNVERQDKVVYKRGFTSTTMALSAKTCYDYKKGQYKKDYSINDLLQYIIVPEPPLRNPSSKSSSTTTTFGPFRPTKAYHPSLKDGVRGKPYYSKIKRHAKMPPSFMSTKKQPKKRQQRLINYVIKPMITEN